MSQEKQKTGPTASQMQPGSRTAAHDPIAAMPEDMGVRVYVFRGRPCVIASAVGRALGYAEKSLVKRVRGEWAAEMIEGKDFAVLSLAESREMLAGGVPESGTLNPRGVTVLFESGWDLVCIKTDKPEGQRLRRRLADEVLPKLRRGEPVTQAPSAPLALSSPPTSLPTSVEGLAMALRPFLHHEFTSALAPMMAKLADLPTREELAVARSESMASFGRLADGLAGLLNAMRVTHDVALATHRGVNEIAGRNGCVSAMQVDQIKAQIAILGEKVLLAGLSKRPHINSARSKVLTALREYVRWNGAGQTIETMPADRLPDVKAFFTYQHSSVDKVLATQRAAVPAREPTDGQSKLFN